MALIEESLFMAGVKVGDTSQGIVENYYLDVNQGQSLAVADSEIESMQLLQDYYDAVITNNK